VFGRFQAVAWFPSFGQSPSTASAQKKQKKNIDAGTITKLVLFIYLFIFKKKNKESVPRWFGLLTSGDTKVVVFFFFPCQLTGYPE
jgi:hypothetical protein